jgi:hypothetical protein
LDKSSLPPGSIRALNPAGQSEAPYEREKVTSTFFLDQDGNPKGGSANGPGFGINWQNGVGEPYGATIEDVIEALMQRLRFFQATRFACAENEGTLHHLERALTSQQARQANRRERGVEGTYQP